MKRIVVWVRVWVLIGILATLGLVWGLRDRAPVEQPRPAVLNTPQAPVFVPPADYLAGADIPPMEISPEDRAEAGRERSDNGLKMIFCWCPPGRFRMGNTPGVRWRFGDAQPVQVTLSQGFWIGKYEVTQGQWAAVMGMTLSQQRAKDPTQPRPVGDGTSREHIGKGPDHPIYFVSYEDATEFCRRLTEEETKAGRLAAGTHYQLPTEAQWEYACRAGTTTLTGLGDQLSSNDANFDGTVPQTGASPGPVSPRDNPRWPLPRNPWGVHDMHGNVWELCRDGYQAKLSGGDDPAGPASAKLYVMRGGCWHNNDLMCLPTSRGFSAPNGRGSGLGFRVCLVQSKSL